MSGKCEPLEMLKTQVNEEDFSNLAHVLVSPTTTPSQIGGQTNKTNAHKQLFGIAQGMGGAQKMFICRLLLGGNGNTKTFPEHLKKMSRQSQGILALNKDCF